MPLSGLQHPQFTISCIIAAHFTNDPAGTSYLVSMVSDPLDVCLLCLIIGMFVSGGVLRYRYKLMARIHVGAVLFEVFHPAFKLMLFVNDRQRLFVSSSVLRSVFGNFCLWWA